MSRKTLLERMDDAAHWTGIPAMAANGPRRRPLRWPSTIALLMAGIGFLAALARPDAWWLSYPLLLLAVMVSVFMPIFGPLKSWTGLELIDEREQIEQARAYLAAFGTIAFATMIAIPMIVGLALVSNLSMWTMSLLLIDLLLLIATLFMAGPTCFASWAEQPLEDDDEA